MFGKRARFKVKKLGTARFGVVDVVWGVATCCKDVAATMARAGAIVAHEVYKGVVASTTIVIKSSTTRSTQSPNRRQTSDDTHSVPMSRLEPVPGPTPDVRRHTHSAYVSSRIVATTLAWLNP